jgi:hypothetical protein
MDMERNMRRYAGQTKAEPILMTAIFLGLLLLLTSGRADAGLVEIPDMAFKINASMGENLKALAGKKVNVTLASGSTFTGIVKAVGKDFLHLEKLEGKEYFDALIRLAEISAIDARFRDYQR